MTTNQDANLIIITQHFSPSTGATAQLVTELADGLNKRGIKVAVLTSKQSNKKPYPVFFCVSKSASSHNIFSKFLEGLVFFIASLSWLLINLKPTQLILIVSNPPFIGLLGPIIRFFCHSRYIFLFQDIFPRSAALTGIMPARGPIFSFWRILTKLVLEKSETCLVLSDSMVKRCRRDFGQNFCIEVVSNWSVVKPKPISERLSKSYTECLNDLPFIVQYSGNFGRLHDMLTILESSRLTQLLTSDILFEFIGNGSKKQQIESYMQRYNLENVRLRDYQPLASLEQSISSCSVSLVSLMPGSEDTVAPSKLYTILACARPVIVISSSESEIAKLITDSQCGFVLNSGDPKKLSELVLMLSANPLLCHKLGMNARRLYENKYRFSETLLKYESIISRYI